eukprot:SAG22_NODE_15770_length_341_cov_0.822314_1_plen_23_part_10
MRLPRDGGIVPESVVLERASCVR